MLDSFEATNILETLLSSEEISKLIDDAISVNIYQMCIVNLTEEEVTAQVTTLLYFHIDYHYHSIVYFYWIMKIFKLHELVPGIVRWIHEITPNYLPSCRVKLHGSPRNIKYTTGEYPMHYAVDELTGTEETVWCPMLGIKGQIDMVIKTANYSKEDKATHSPRRSYNLPLEVKTGKYNPNTAITHRAQVCFLEVFYFYFYFY